MLGLLGAVLPTINNVIDRVVPDKNAAQKAKAELMTMQVKGELDSMMGQLEINKAEAQHASVFVAGWRPFVGWAAGGALLYQTVGLPTAKMFGLDAPEIDTSALTTILMTMLGAGAMRSFDKAKAQGGARSSIKPPKEASK